ncbi:MAG: hypothetical protein K9J80_00010 [Sulfuritalea sp.]|nr:hypothetical protein [Sulfuritalea sp.]
MLAQFAFGPGNYTTSISGVTFIHNGGAIPGLSTGEVGTCGSSHIHGAIGANGDPGGTCGHGTPVFLSALSVNYSGSTPNSAANLLNNTAGVLASRPTPSYIQPPYDFAKEERDRRLSEDREMLRWAAVSSGFARARRPITLRRDGRYLPLTLADVKTQNPHLSDYEAERAFADFMAEDAYWQQVGQELRESRSRDAALRDDAAKPPPVPPAANPPADAATAATGEGTILDSITEPTPEDIRKEYAAQDARRLERRKAEDAVAAEVEKAQDRAAQNIVDALFSGNKDKGEAAASTFGIADKEVQNRVTQKIIERVGKTVDDARRAATNAAAGPPQSIN